MKKIIILFMSILIMSTGTLSALNKKDLKKDPKNKVKKIPELPVLSIGDFIKKSVFNNPFVKKVKSELREGRFSAKRALAIRDFMLTIAPSYTWADPLENSGMSVGSRYSKYDLTASLTKKFPSFLGLSTKVELGYSKTSFVPVSSSDVTSYKPYLGFSITMPLLSNFLGKADNNTLKNMSLSIKILEKSEKEAYEAFLMDLYYQYYDWALLVEKTSIYKGFMKRSAVTLGQVIRKRNVGLSDWADVHLVRQGYLRYKAQYLSAEMSADNQYLKILSMMKGVHLKKAQRKKNIDVNLRPHLSFNIKNDKSIGLSDKLENLRPVQIARIQYEQAKVNFDSAKSFAKPSLDFILSGSKGGSGSSFGSSFDSFDRDQFYTGFELGIPLQNTDKKNEKHSKKAGKVRAKKNYQENLIKISYTLKNLRYSIVTLKKILKVNADVVKTSQYRVGAVLRKYYQGRVDLLRVTDARDSYANARISYLEQSVILKKMMIEYKALTDKLFDVHRKLF
ncbi:MAG: TolC family protein [Spirochaetes bacterium]|nr:TolC family protein [Spirochaetota bacterium]